MIALGSDHGGYRLKLSVIRYLEQEKIQYRDYGTYSEDSCDYPVFAQKACAAVVSRECEKALLFCGTGVGIGIAANKIRGIRAATCSDYYSAKYSRLHNDANVLCLGGRVLGPGAAEELVRVFLSTEFLGGRHARRVAEIAQLENGQPPKAGPCGGCPSGGFAADEKSGARTTKN